MIEGMVNVVYLGTDRRYLGILEKRFQKEFPETNFSFFQVWRDEYSTFQSVIVEIADKNPRILFLDYTLETKKVLTVARTVVRVLPNLMSVIGLWDYPAAKEFISEGNITGVPVSHIKGVEVGSVVLHAMFLLDREGVDLEKWAKAEVYDGLVLPFVHQMKVGFITKKYLHVEHDLVPLKSSFTLKTWFSKDWPIKYYTHAREIDENFYYHFQRSSDFKFIYRPALGKKKDLSKKEIEWGERHQKETEELRMKKVADWFKSFPNENHPKRTKLMIIDSELSIVKQADRPLDEYPFSVRFYKEIDDFGKIIRRVKAGIICFQCSQSNEGEEQKVIEQIKSIDGYSPFVLIFHSKSSSEKLKEQLSYERVIAYRKKFDLEQLLEFCRLYESREGRDKTHNPARSYHKKEERVYPPKDAPESYVEYHMGAEIRELSETYVKFQCWETLPERSLYTVEWPISMVLTVVDEIVEEDWKKEGMKQYRALIHCVGERELASLRRAVNQVIQEKMDAEQT